MNLGIAIKQVRKEKGISQVMLSEKTGISQTSISQIESSDNWPHKNSLIKIAKALKVKLAYLLVLSVEEKDIPAINKQEFDMHIKQIIQLLKT